MAPPRLGFVPPPRRWEQGRTTRPEGCLPGWSPANLAVPESVGGGLLSLPPTAPAFSLAFCPHPPTPLPLRGRGRPKVYFAGGFAPGTPTLNRPRHLQTLPSSPPPGTAKRRSSQCRAPSSPGDARGRSPLHKKTKSLPLPAGKGVGGMGAKGKAKGRGDRRQRGQAPAGHRQRSPSRRGWGKPPAGHRQTQG